MRTQLWIALTMTGCLGGTAPWDVGSLLVDDAACGGGLGWETADPAVYQALTCEGTEALVWMSFDPALRDLPAKERDLDAFHSHFRYINLWVYDTQRTRGNRTVYWSNRSPIREVTFDAVDGMRLQWRMTVWVDEVTTQRESNLPGCVTGDIGGICYSSEPAEVEMDLTFDLTVGAGAS